MRIELITIGDELLLGQIVNTNIAFIGSKIAEQGLRVAAQMSVPDEEEALEAAIRQALDRSDVVITTGGLGPTVDDTTKSVFCGIFGKELSENKMILDDLLTRYGQDCSEAVRSQATVPEDTEIIMNSVGTAPGFIFSDGKKLAIVLPGPPRELAPMLEEVVLPKLSQISHIGGFYLQKTLRTISVGESDVDQRMRRLIQQVESVSYGLMARPYQVDIRLSCIAESKECAREFISEAEGLVRGEFGNSIFGEAKQKLEEVVGKMLRENRLTIALAESCTGGLISSRITDISGSSDYLRGTMVVYSNDWKQNLLDVPAKVLEEHGAVSEETARAMAEGVRKKGQSDLGLAVTGIAGPTGGSDQKPVGLVYIALSDSRKTTCKKFNFPGDREVVKFRSSQVALNMVRRYILTLNNSED